jgi:hypothetical protein
LEKKGIEIGLHGYRHELWGPAQWYLSDKPLPVEQKASLLKAGIEAFSSSGLRRPVVFRAPNLVADDSTIQLLPGNGFQVDSSLPAHKGVLPIPLFLDELIRIPVTVDPTPKVSWTALVPYCRFRACNLKTLKHMAPDEFFKYISGITAIQEALGFPPHVVILCHSWEFFSPLIDNKQYDYCSPQNSDFLDKLIRNLSEDFNIREISMQHLADLFKRKGTALTIS